MKVKTAELTGTALDWAVQDLEFVWALTRTPPRPIKAWVLAQHQKGQGQSPYSTDWEWGGPIIEREGIATRKHSNGNWYAMLSSHLGDGTRAGWFEKFWIESDRQVQRRFIGPTTLIAAMRCYVASKLGDEVNVPATGGTVK